MTTKLTASTAARLLKAANFAFGKTSRYDRMTGTKETPVLLNGVEVGTIEVHHDEIEISRCSKECRVVVRCAESWLMNAPLEAALGLPAETVRRALDLHYEWANVDYTRGVQSHGARGAVEAKRMIKFTLAALLAARVAAIPAL